MRLLPDSMRLLPDAEPEPEPEPEPGPEPAAAFEEPVERPSPSVKRTRVEVDLK